MFRASIFSIIGLLVITVSCKREEDISFEDSPVLQTIESTAIMEEGSRNRVLDSISTVVIRSTIDTTRVNLLFKIAGTYYNAGSYERYKIICHSILNLSRDINDSLSIAKSMRYLGDYHEVTVQMDSALLYYTKSEKIYRRIKDSLNTGRLQLYKAGILYDIGGYAESEALTIDALRSIAGQGDTRLIYECYVQIALSLKELKSYKKSLEYFEAATQTLKKLENENYDKDKILLSTAACFNNIGQVYLKKLEYSKAKSYFENGLKTQGLDKKRPALYAMLLNNLASAKMSLQDNHNDIEKLLFEALQVREANNLKQGVIASKLNIGTYLIQRKDTLQALLYIKEGYLKAKEIKSNYDILRALTLLVQHDADNTKYYTSLYITSSEQIYEMQVDTRNKFARIAYESDVTEQENKVLVKKNIYITLCAVIGCTLLFALLIIYKLNARRKELLYKQEQQNSNAKIYNLLLSQKNSVNNARSKERRRIAMDLHDRVINRIFTTRFNLMQLESYNEEKKEKLVQELQGAEEDIRQISHELSNNIFTDTTDFYEITRNYLDSQNAAGKMTFELFVDKFIDWSVVTIELKINLYSIIQEAVKNATKHSGASLCNVAIFLEYDSLKMRIWDNGKGFTTKKQFKGIGLRNMADRVKNLGGTFNISSSVLSGTTIEINVKISNDFDIEYAGNGTDNTPYK